MKVLDREWSFALGELVGAASRELTIVSPFISAAGADLVEAQASSRLRRNGVIRFVTDFAPVAICNGAIEPDAVRRMCSLCAAHSLSHLPRLHAKVYISDGRRAIVTSGNLTQGGLKHNFECGVLVETVKAVQSLQEYLFGLAALGAPISRSHLEELCRVGPELQAAYKREHSAASSRRSRAFASKLRRVDDDLIRAKLQGGAVHTVFARSIEFLLGEYGRMRTVDLHARIQALHPDLCDDTVERVIDGKRFGKKWKHAVRTAQQQLKKRGAAVYEGGWWRLAPKQ